VGKWYKPNQKLAAQIAAVLAETKRIGNKATKLRKSVGATNLFSRGDGNFEIVGFEFADEPPKELWKKTKDHGWVPKKTTNRDVFDKMQECRHDTWKQIAKLIDFNTFHLVPTDTGVGVETFGWRIAKDGKMFLEMPERFTKVKDCTAELKLRAT
jgi:hypothetical protein